MSNWLNAPDEEELLKYHGFVYRITRLNAKEGEKRFYVGCKKIHSKRKLPPLKGAKRKRTVIKKSDFETYYGSSNELLADIEKHGKENFQREILKLCKSQWQLKYEELYHQIQERAILDRSYYNAILNLRIGKIPKDLYEEYNK
jgi:hypothetical protein